jgi:hypothetical protein
MENVTFTPAECIAKIQPLLSKYSLKASLRSDHVVLINAKGVIAGRIDLADGVRVMQRYEGNRNMMGSLIRDDFRALLGGESGKY